MESSSTTTTTRRPYFIEESNGLASIAHTHHNNNTNNNNNNNNGYFVDCHNNHMMRRKNSLRNISSLNTNFSSHVSSTCATTAVFSPRSTRMFDPRFEEVHSPHFLESCALCHKPLGGNRDIFMYRGDTPFCSEECREEQIEIDEAKEKNWNLKVLRSKKEGKKSGSSSSPSKPQNYPLRSGTIAAA